MTQHWHDDEPCDLSNAECDSQMDRRTCDSCGRVISASVVRCDDCIAAYSAQEFCFLYVKARDWERLAHPFVD